jgi:hypothetical protein
MCALIPRQTAKPVLAPAPNGGKFLLLPKLSMERASESKRERERERESEREREREI